MLPASVGDCPALGLPEYAAHLYSLIGSVCWKRANHDQATEYYLLSLEIRKGIDNPVGAAECYISLAEGALKKDEPKIAENYSMSGLKIAKQMGISQITAAAINTIGQIEQRKGAW